MLWLFTTTLSWVRSRRSRKTHPVVSLMDHVRPYLSSFVLEEKSRREKWRQSKCRRELPICASGKTSLSPGGRTGPLGIFTDPAHRAESPLRTGFLSTVDSGKRGGNSIALHFGITLDYGSEIKSSCLGMVQAGASLHSGSDGFAGIRPQVGAVEPDGDWPQQRHSFA